MEVLNALDRPERWATRVPSAEVWKFLRRRRQPSRSVDDTLGELFVRITKIRVVYVCSLKRGIADF